MGLTKDEVRILKAVFSEFNQNDIGFVILRKHEKLPSDVEGDVDIQVEVENFEKAIELCQSKSFTIDHSTSNEIIELLIKSITQPKEAFYWIRNKPRDVINEIKTTSDPYSGGSYDYKSIKLDRNNIRFDVKNRLAYRSPMNNQRIRVNPKVEEKLYQRKIKQDEYYIPSPPDELAHIVCHCVFDKEGVFSEYYKKRSEELLHEVKKDKDYHQQFQELLSLLFFDASTFVMKKLEQGKYDNLRQDLYKFDDY